MKKVFSNTYGFTFVEFSLVIIVLAIIGVSGYFVVRHETNKTAQTIQTKQSSISTDIWTGAGHDNKWSTPSNWSNGVPKNNADLVFNMSKLSNSQTIDSSGDVPVDNDLSNLVIHTVTFSGERKLSSSNIARYEITGNGFSLDDGIINDSSLLAVIESSITLTNSQSFFGSYPSGGEPYNGLQLGALNIGKYNLIISNNLAMGVTVTNIEGSGKITGGISLSSEVTANSEVTAESSFTGQLILKNGDLADINTAVSNPLGSAKITIENGGQLTVNAPNLDISLNNPISVQGNGPRSGSGYAGDGAVIVCATSLNLKQPLTLTGDTTLGGCSDSGPNTVNILNGLESGNFMLQTSITYPLVINNT